MERSPLEVVVDDLAGFAVAGWAGLPAGLSVDDSVDADAPAALELGDDHVPADMVHLGGSARAWSRGGHVVLVDVALQPEGDASQLDGLGPADVEPVRYGLVWADERVYAGRGLAAIVDGGDGDVVRHVVGFVPTSAHEYRRSLRPGFATTRRPREDR
jgi:hypothetical protein